MGYSVKKEHIINNQEMLDSILANVKRGQTTYLEPESGSEDLSYWQYKVHTILKSAEQLVGVMGGKYSALRGLVKVSMEQGKIAIIPKITNQDANKLLVSAHQFTEQDLVADLAHNPPTRSLQTELREFYPSKDYDEDELKKRIKKETEWESAPLLFRDDPEGPIQITVMNMSSGMTPIEAIQRKNSAMARLGFGKAE